MGKIEAEPSLDPFTALGPEVITFHYQVRKVPPGSAEGLGVEISNGLMLEIDPDKGEKRARLSITHFNTGFFSKLKGLLIVAGDWVDINGYVGYTPDHVKEATSYGTEDDRFVLDNEIWTFYTNFDDTYMGFDSGRTYAILENWQGKQDLTRDMISAALSMLGTPEGFRAEISDNIIGMLFKGLKKISDIKEAALLKPEPERRRTLDYIDYEMDPSLAPKPHIRPTAEIHGEDEPPYQY